MKSAELQRRGGLLSLCVVFLHGLFPAFSQQISVNTAELQPLVNEWNFANQRRSIEALKRVYADSISYFGELKTKESLLTAKKNFFKTYPQFTQAINSPVNYVAYSSGVIKADFILDLKNGEVPFASTHAYLVLSYEKNSYKIIGESDVTSDAKNRFHLDLGDSLQFDDAYNHGSDSGITTFSIHEPKAVLQKLASSIVFSEEVISISLRDVSIIASMLLITFVCLIFSLARSKRKSRNGSKLMTLRTAGSGKVSQQAFQRFVVSLFDPLYFSLIGPNATNGHRYKGIDLELQFRKNDVKAFVALRCLYYAERINGAIPLIPKDTIQYFLQTAQNSDEIEFYLIVGIGGKPEDPAETYLLAVRDLSGESVAYHHLQQYRKYGMFFYNANTGQLT